MSTSAEKLWLCDDRGVTDIERPWLSLPAEEMLLKVTAAVEEAGYSETVADSIAGWLWRKKMGLRVSREAPTKARFRKILAEVGPPPRKGRGQGGYASVKALGTVAAACVSFAALARGNAPVALAGLYITNTGPDELEQELLAA